MSLPKIATKCILGQSLREQGFLHSNLPQYYSIKVPVFPFDRLGPHLLGPEMRSTGEMMMFKKNVTTLDKESIKHTTFDFYSLQELVVN